MLPGLLLVLALWLTGGAGSAHALEGPPPTPVPPRGSPSPFLQKLDDAGRTLKPPPIGAKTVILADLETGQTLFAVRPTLRRPIASLTKVMTGLLTIERTDPDEDVRVSAEAAPPKNLFGLSALGLVAGETLSVKQLMYALLVQSANDAAVALAEHISGTTADFEHLMNRRAGQLGLEDTRFASPNGLDDDGYSTAADLAELTRAAMAEPEFARIVRTKFHTIPAATRGDPPREIQNRNVLLWLYPGARGVKTGFTSKAGYCVIATAMRGSRSLVVVVLGARGEAFSDAAELLTYGFKGFVPKTVLERGEELGTREISGARVGIAAAEALDLLVPRKGGEPVTHLALDPADPVTVPAVGDVVGEARVTSGRVTLGSVRAVASSIDGTAHAPPTTGVLDVRLLRRAGSLAVALVLEAAEDQLALSAL